MGISSGNAHFLFLFRLKSSAVWNESLCINDFPSLDTTSIFLIIWIRGSFEKVQIKPVIPFGNQIN